MKPDPFWLRYLPLFVREKLTGRINLFAIIHNSGWLMFDKMIRLLLGLLVGAWVARYLGPTQYGELAYVLAYIAFFQAVAVLGMDGIVVRDIARDKEQAGEILGTAFVMRLVAGILCWLTAVGGMALINGWQDRSVLITALAGSALIFQAIDTIDLWFQSQSQSRRTVAVKLTAYILSNGLKVVLILNNASLPFFAAAMAIDVITAAIGLAIAYRRFPCDQKWKHILNLSKALFEESWPYIISSMSIMIYMRIDQIMIKEMLGEKELGLYAVVNTLSSLWYVIPVTFCLSIAPYIAKNKQESEEKYYERLLLLFRILLAISILIVVMVLIFSDVIVILLYGIEYSGVADVLRVYVISVVPVFLGVAQGLWVSNEKLPHISMYKTFIGAFISVLGNYLLIPIFGLYGAAFTTVTAQFISAVFSNIFFSRKILLMQMGLRA